MEALHGTVIGIIGRVLAVYIIVLISMRVMGKREIGKLSVFDMVIWIMIAEISAVALERPETPLLRGILIIVVLAVLQVFMSFVTLKVKWLRRVIDGSASPLIVNGQINERVMRRSRYTLTDLMTQLREKNILSVADVEFAILETTGKLSVFPKPSKRPLTQGDLNIIRPGNSLPIPLIIEGKVLDSSLRRLEKSRHWLKKALEDYGHSEFKDIFYCSIDNEGNLYIDLIDSNHINVEDEILRDF